VEPQARGFVHDEDLVVLVENLEGLGVGDERDGATPCGGSNAREMR
jgi:hypothetical protein